MAVLVLRLISIIDLPLLKSGGSSCLLSPEDASAGLEERARIAQRAGEPSKRSAFSEARRESATEPSRRGQRASGGDSRQELPPSLKR